MSQHGFPFPGTLIEMRQEQCAAACPEGDDCGCADIGPEDTFDVGSFLFHLFGRFVATGGMELTTDQCLSRADCDFLPGPPEKRALGQN